MRVVGGEIRKPQEMAGEAESWELCTCSVLLGDNFVLLYLHCRGGGELSEEEERDGWSRGHQGAYRANCYLTKGPSRAIHCNGT